MTQRRLALALAALLTIAALGFVATAIDDTTPGGGPESDGTDVTSGGASETGQSSNSETVAAALVVVLLVLAVGGIGAAAYRDSLPRWLVVVLVASVVVLLLLVAIGQFVDPTGTDDGPSGGTPATETPVSETTPTATGPSDGGEPGPLSTTGTLVLLGLLLVGGALVVTRFSRGVPDDPDTTEPDETAAVAAAAGRAADELEETTLSNAVFRAWREMTDALDVENPGTTTPAEFEDIAVEAGLDREDVATLTDLFREVRYGDVPATEEREKRARTALRHIEESYTETDRNGGLVNSESVGTGSTGSGGAQE